MKTLLYTQSWHSAKTLQRSSSVPLSRTLSKLTRIALPPRPKRYVRLIAGETVLKCLIEAAANGHDWVLATLDRLPPNLVKPAIAGSDLFGKLAPMLLLSEGANWLASEDRVMDLAFLTKQNL
jgi:hypothetical protein